MDILFFHVSPVHSPLFFSVLPCLLALPATLPTFSPILPCCDSCFFAIIFCYFGHRDYMTDVNLFFTPPFTLPLQLPIAVTVGRFVPLWTTFPPPRITAVPYGLRCTRPFTFGLRGPTRFAILPDSGRTTYRYASTASCISLLPRTALHLAADRCPRLATPLLAHTPPAPSQTQPHFPYGIATVGDNSCWLVGWTLLQPAPRRNLPPPAPIPLVFWS